MDITGIGSLADFGTAIISRIWPDATEQAKAKIALAQMQQTGELAQLAAQTGLIQGQLDINKVEAASPSLFVAGWRPAIGWVCASAVAIDFILSPMVTWISALLNHLVTFPQLDINTLMGLLTAMLGIGAMRTTEKIKGVAK